MAGLAPVDDVGIWWRRMQPERLVPTSRSLDVDVMKPGTREDPKSTEYCVTDVEEEDKKKDEMGWKSEMYKESGLGGQEAG